MRDCPHQRKRTEPARSDSFSYNGRNELTTATLGAAPYGYSYGQHRQPQDGAGTGRGTRLRGQRTPTSTPALKKAGKRPLCRRTTPRATRPSIRTSTGIWTVAYNAANRATSFTSRDGATVVECGYDYQGRRFMKKVTVTAQSPAMNAICTRLFADRPPWTAGHRTNRINKGEPSICFLCLS